MVGLRQISQWQGKSCSCSLLLVPGSPTHLPPSNVDLEKLDICSNMVATWHVQTCSESFLPQPTSLLFRGHIWKQNSFVPHEYLILLKAQDEHLRALFPLPSQAWGRRQETAMFWLTLRRLPLDVWYPNKPLSHWTAERLFSRGVLGEPAVCPPYTNSELSWAKKDGGDKW